MPKWLKNIGWVEAVAGFIVGALAIFSLVYTSGQSNANTRRDINENTQHIEINERNIKVNAQRIESNRVEYRAGMRDLQQDVAHQETTLARIEEGVDWIKKELQK